MKTQFFIIAILLLTCNLYAQEENVMDSKTSKKLTREQRIEQQRLEEEATAKLVDQMVKQRQFVLEANMLSDRYGYRAVVSSTINFIAIDSSKVTIQLASTTGIGGANGMGGVTTDGNITNWKESRIGKNEDKGYYIKMTTMTSFGIFDIYFMISPSSVTDARVRGNWGGEIRYEGKIVPLNKSRVFKAMSL
jgi:hypothetical protein